MWKSRKSWRIAFASTSSLNALRPLLLLCASMLFFSCAEHAVLVTPKITLVDPASFQNPKPKSAYKYAYAAYERGDQRHARADFQKLLRKEPSYYPALLGVAYTYLAEGNLDLAERYIHRALDAERPAQHGFWERL